MMNKNCVGIKKAIRDEIITMGITARRDTDTIFTSISPYLKNPRVALLIPNDWVIRPMITLSGRVKPRPNSGRTTEKNGTNNNAPLTPSIFTRSAMQNAMGNIQIKDTQYPVSWGVSIKRDARKIGIIKRTIICSYSSILNTSEVRGLGVFFVMIHPCQKDWFSHCIISFLHDLKMPFTGCICVSPVLPGPVLKKCLFIFSFSGWEYFAFDLLF